MLTETFKIIIGLIVTFSPILICGEEPSPEIIYTFEEDRAMSKWKNNNSSLEDIVKEAFMGNSAALCLLGHCYLYGTCGLTINVASADRFFSKSASLGFAPAIDEIAISYLHRNPNPCLALVYKNLAISFGHSEMVIAYHQGREIIAKQLGSHICEEIEKIAARKRKKILVNQKNISLAKEKIKFFISFVASENIITDEDILFGNDYWFKLIKKSQQK